MRIVLAWLFAAPLLAAPPDLEEVACTWCHYEEADEFIESVHYQQGHLLCDDCHGGLPFEEDPDLAKAPEAGFIGKPGRGDVAGVCAQCHSGPAGFFAQGPHHEWQNEANPTCISCHNNHKVLAADLALMDETCGQCHDEWSAALDKGQKIRVELEVSAEHLARVTGVVDSLAGLDRSLQKARPLIAEAEAVLQAADAATHALDVQLLEEMVVEARGEQGIAGAEAVVEAYYQEMRLRPRIVVGLWIFILVNVALFRWKRRDLDK